MRLQKQDLGVVLFVVTLAASLTLNVLQFQWQTETPSNQRPAGFAEASVLPSLPFETTDGQHDLITFDKDTLVYVFAPGCSWCKRDYPNIDVIQRATAQRFRFVAITRYGDNAPRAYEELLESYLREHKYAQVALVRGEEISAEVVRGLGLTPQLLVVRPGGKIARAWHGAITGRALEDAEEFFGVRLQNAAVAESQ